MTDKEYRQFHKIEKLRKKIKDRTTELNIVPDHDDTAHYYKLNGVRYPSVTGALQILKDPGLMNWKMNRALEHVRTELATEMYNLNRPEDMDRLFAEAKLAPVKEFEGAGSIGTEVHNWRESWFSKIINGNNIQDYLQYQHDSRIEVISACRAIAKFMSDTKYTPVACELYLVDPTLSIGGTADDIGVLNGKLGFMDLKTSNIGDKDSYFYQVAIYVYMFEKLYGIRTHWHKILHVSKTDGSYKLIDIPDIRKRIKEAKIIVKVDQFLKSLRQEKKKETILL